MNKTIIICFSSLFALVACSRAQEAPAPDTQTAPTAAPEASTTCAATQIDGTPIATATAPLDANGKPDLGACRTSIEPQIRAAVCGKGTPPEYMYKIGAQTPIRVPVVCPVTATAAVTTGTPTVTAAHAPAADPKAGGVGTCTATRLDGSLIGVEIAPATHGGLSHDYVACRAKLEPKIKAAVCAGKTSGSAAYFYKIGAGATLKNEMLCR